MSDSVRPHRRQPTRLPCPWDSPGKNTGVGCHFLLQCVKVKGKSLSSVRLLATPWTAAYQAPHGKSWDFPGKSTGVGCHCLLRCLVYFILWYCSQCYYTWSQLKCLHVLLFNLIKAKWLVLILLLILDFFPFLYHDYYSNCFCFHQK